MACIKRIFVFVVFCSISLAEVVPNLPSVILQRKRRVASDCGEVLQGSEGSFSLPTEECGNGTYQCYRKNQECQWSIDAPAGHVVMLKSEDFDLEPSDDCVWDYVEIVEEDGRTTKHCGWYPLVYISTTSKLTINFKSDETYEGTGFSFEYNSYIPDFSSRCNTSLLGGQNGEFTNEATAKDCFYSIQAPQGKVVQLNLDKLNFDSNTCHEEQLIIHSGSTMQGSRVGKVCSDRNLGPLPGPYESVFIEYVNTVETAGKRFTISYEFVDPPSDKKLPPSPFGSDPDCSHFFKGVLKDGVEVFEAPKYESNRNCIVVVRNTLLPNSVVQVSFEKFHLEESENCTYDSLQIKLGERATSKTLGGPYCGKELDGRTFVSHGNSLRLEYKTDESLSWFGVRVKISFVERGHMQKNYSRRKTYRYVEILTNNNVRDAVVGCDECDSGVCILQDHEKICIQGKTCDDSQCQNGGTCVKSQTYSTRCYCPIGFSGDDCSQGSGIHLKDPPRKRQVKTGESIYPRCYTGFDGPETVIWYFNGERMGSYDADEERGTLDDGFLQIKDFGRDDEGMYTCIVENSHGTLEHTFELSSIKDCEVEFSTRPTKQTVHFGNDVLFPCRPRHAVSFHWEYARSSGSFFERVNGDRFEQQPGSGYLLIKDITPDDAGIYKCVAEDVAGCFSSRQAALVILETKKYNNYCGISRHDEENLHTKVYHGEGSKPGDNPWHVTININIANSICGGTLISTKYVITAAHCLELIQSDGTLIPFTKENVKLSFGSTSCRESRYVRAPERYIIHENYNRKTHDNDIAIIQLDQPIEFNDDVRPACLDSETNIDTMFFHRSSVFGKVAGCGKVTKGHMNILAKTLQEVDLPLVKKEQCESLVKSYNSKNKRKAYLTDNKICAGYRKVGKRDVCKGDSGGGYMMDHAFQHYLTGIVSSGPTCGGGSEMVGFYTNVGKYFYWIDEKTEFTKEKCENCDWAT